LKEKGKVEGLWERGQNRLAAPLSEGGFLEGDGTRVNGAKTRKKKRNPWEGKLGGQACEKKVNGEKVALQCLEMRQKQT